MEKTTRLNADPEIMQRFYRHLGELFYAIAKADGFVHSKEEKALHDAVREHWLPLEDSVDEFQTDAAFQIEAVFDYLDADGRDAESCFDDFQLFVKDFPNLFPAPVAQGVLSTAKGIASAFHGTNKSELDMLFRLERLLKDAQSQS